MKIYLVIISAALFFNSCKNDNARRSADVNRASTDTSNYTAIQWTERVKNVGVLKFGEKAEIKFQFKNIGDKPLYVIDARPGCGCTIVDFPKEAIAPGAANAITAGFDTKKGSEGAFTKNILITTNTKGSTSTDLIFKGEIKK